MWDRRVLFTIAAALGATACKVNGKSIGWPGGSSGGDDASSASAEPDGDDDVGGGGDEATTVSPIPAGARPGWCDVPGSDKVTATMVGWTLDKTDADANEMISDLVGHFCGDETTERRDELEALHAAWSKRLRMNDADWKDAVEWAVRPVHERGGAEIRVDGKRALSSLDAVEQYLLIEKTNDDKAYLADAFGPQLTAAGRMAFVEDCLRVDAVGIWAVCHADLVAFDPDTISAAIRTAKDRSGHERTVVRLTMDRLQGRVTERLAEIKKLIAADAAYGELFSTGERVHKTWAARDKNDPALALALKMDDGLRSNSRRSFEGCDEDTWTAFAAHVAAVPAARFSDLSGTEERSFAGRAASVVLDTPDAYLAGNALLICAKGRDQEFDYLLRTLAAEMSNRPGYRGPRTATHTALVAAAITLDDRNARIQYQGVQRGWMSSSGSHGGLGRGVVASVEDTGKGVVITFAKEMSTYQECAKWKTGSRIDRVDNDGNVYYEQTCTKYKTEKFDKASAPQTVSARYITGVKKGTYVEVVEDVVLVTRAKDGGVPLAVFGVAVK